MESKSVPGDKSTVILQLAACPVYWFSSTPSLFQRAEIVPTCPSPQLLWLMLQTGEMEKLGEEATHKTQTIFLYYYKTIRQYKGSAMPAKLV